MVINKFCHFCFFVCFFVLFCFVLFFTVLTYMYDAISCHRGVTRIVMVLTLVDMDRVDKDVPNTSSEDPQKTYGEGSCNNTPP